MVLRSFEESVRLLHDRVNLERLQSFSAHDMEGRLDTLQQILDAFGNPEANYRTIHVAGTKGKGSTCIMLESLFLAEGYRVGRFISPHLYSFTERLSVNGIPCPPDEFAELFFSVYEQIDSNTIKTLSYFELLTLLAFIYFFQKRVDVAIFEVGLGGRLDATNLCCPDVSVITSISLDHTVQLGSTLPDIAREKSGIIKPDVPAVTTVLHPVPQNIIRDKALSVGAPLFVLNGHFFIQRSDSLQASRYTFRFVTQPPEFPVEFLLDNVTLSMPGGHQIRNASAAVAAFLLFHQDRETFNKETMRTALQHAFLPIRGEVIRMSEESPVLIFDGAHNRSSVRAFITMVSEEFSERRLFLVFGTSMGKDIEGMFAEISGRFHHIFLTQSSHSSRRFPPQGLRSILATFDNECSEDFTCDEDFLASSVSLQPALIDTVSLPLDIDREMANITLVENCKEALSQCLSMAHSRDVICVTGSLFLAAELRQWFLERDHSPQ